MPGDASAGGEQDAGESLVRVSVGGLLRAERERRSLTLDDVAANVRIRRTQLDAIENGRFNELPGAPYAVGFVRTYAEFLDLDRDEVVRRFKAEAAGLDNRKELHFPRPLSESRLPGGVVLLISIVIAAGAYGFWYFHGAAERAPLPRVAAIPERLAPLADPAPAHQPEAPPKEAAALADPVASLQDNTASAAMAPTSTPSMPMTSAGASAAAGDTPPTTATVPAAAPTPSATATTRSPSPAQPSPAATVVATAPAESSDASAIPAAPAESASQPRVYGETAGSRVVIRAAADSWIQIRDTGGNVLFTRVLRTGDAYNVPNRQGLLLYTGSAGALDIRVDGRAIPPVGKTGMVRRDVPLDPERLLAGGATPTESSRPASSGG